MSSLSKERKKEKNHRNISKLKKKDGESSDGVLDRKTQRSYVTVTKKKRRRKYEGGPVPLQEERDSLSQAGAAKRSPKPLVTV